MKEDTIREVNGYQIETRGSFATVKRWAVSKNEKFIRVFFKFRDAKLACETNNFSQGLERDIY